MKTTLLVNPAVTEVELVYRYRQPAAERPKITCSRDAYQVLRAVWDEDKVGLLEQFRVLLLDRANRVMACSLISTGGMAGTVVDPKIIFALALKAKAHALLLAHNHPSASLKPSQADLDLTRRLKQAGNVLELPVLDHLILSPEDEYYSFADEGTL